MIESPYRSRAGEITIDGESYRLRTNIGGQSDVGSADERQYLLDQPAIYADFSGGMGASLASRPGMYGWGEWIDTFSAPGMVLPAGKVYEFDVDGGYLGYDFGLSAAFELGADLYLCSGRGIYKCAGGTSASLTIAKDIGDGYATADAVVWKDAAYIGTYAVSTTAPDLLYRTVDGAVFTTTAGLKRKHLAVVTWRPTGTPIDVIIGTSTAFDVTYVSGDPMTAGDWKSPVIRIGSGLFHIRSMVAAPRRVFFGTQVGIRDFDEYAHAPNLTPSWRQRYDIDNGMATALLDNYVYASFVDGLERVALNGERQDIPEPCGVGVGLPFSGPVSGRYTALCTWNGWLIAAIWNQSMNKSYICFGQDRRVAGIEGPGPMVWHGAYTVLDGRVTKLYVHTPQGAALTTRTTYLWIGTANDATGSYHLYRQSLPKGGNAYQDLLYGGQHQYVATGAALYLGDGWPQNPTANRAIWRYDIEAQRMTGVQSVRVEANTDGADADLDGDVDWTEQALSNRSGRVSVIAPSSMGSSARVALRVLLDGTDEQPPVFLSLRVRADINHEIQDVRTYEIDLRDSQDTGIGTAEVRSALSRLRTLQRLAGIRSSRVTVIDEFGVTWQAMVVRIEWGQRRRDNDDYAVSPRLTIRYLYRAIEYSQGDRYDDGHPRG